MGDVSILELLLVCLGGGIVFSVFLLGIESAAKWLCAVPRRRNVLFGFVLGVFILPAEASILYLLYPYFVRH